MAPGGRGNRNPGLGALQTHKPIRQKWRSTLQIFQKEAHSVCLVPSTGHRKPTCCECQAKFGGCLPVPGAEAVLPYWVPLSLRPRKQIQKMARLRSPPSTKACPCPCHRFGGCLPVLRDQAVMPYWVPQCLRTLRKPAFWGLKLGCSAALTTISRNVSHNRELYRKASNRGCVVAAASSDNIISTQESVQIIHHWPILTCSRGGEVAGEIPF
ncbi:uncharacterized protein C16orf95 homolog isoform X2 [Choloepus didactylus]|uniref:uncharacterized protein C16orf95 homolog isoform X2 n=1 Tax=Choloepus didactylus TaxID=27675 RepID=UPI00189E3D70|nr:uncharacterized protein C16orf95 homolog isoform X2 [Choloepus didactylus]